MKPSRRRFLKWGLRAVVAAPFLGLGYGLCEAHMLKVRRSHIELDRLPGEFDNLLCALVADIHHGPYLSLERVGKLVNRVNAAKPDLICLCGDYAYRNSSYIEPCINELGRLSAPMGVFAVLGNHDHWYDAPLSRRMLEQVGIMELTNTNIALERNGARVWLCGVGDLWTDRQDLSAALAGIPADEVRILMSHNPDYAEEINGVPRVPIDLMLSGHTHGGQVSIPFVGPPISPSRYPRKYSGGLVRNGSMQVFVTRGVGTIFPPVRINCPGEFNLLKLTCGRS